LRGAFLSCGTLNDPHKSFHLEFSFASEQARDFTESFLQALQYPPRRVARAKSFGLYYKDGGAIEDLVGLMGSQHVIFEIINSRIEREIRNNENRATNCVARNIQKTVSAAGRQVEAIDLLISRGKLDSMPDSMQTTAMLRYRNPDATLDELTALHQPPIPKSGLNHRLKKLLEEAEDIQRKENL
jgi:DNA-binding protein WhiA